MNTVNNKEKTPGFIKKYWNTLVYVISGIVVIGTIVSGSWVIHLNYQKDELAAEQQRMLMTAKAVARSLNLFLNGHTNQLLIFSNNPDIKQVVFGSASQNRNFLQLDPIKTLYEINKGDINAVYVIDSDGVVMNRQPKKPGAVGKDYSSKPGFQYVSEYHEPYVSEMFKTGSGKKAISITVPVLEEDKLLGVFRWLVYSEVIYLKFLEESNNDNQIVWVIDDGGKIIAHPISYHVGENFLTIHDKKYPRVDWTGLEAVIGSIEAGESGVSTFDYHSTYSETSAPVKKLIAFVPLQVNNQQWTVGVTKVYDEVTRKIARNEKNVHGFAGLLILAFGGIGVVLSRTQSKKAILEAEAENLRKIALTSEALKSAKEDLERQYEELKTLDKMKDSLLSDVMHELKTPVAKQLMQLELLKRFLNEKGLLDAGSKIIKTMESSIERLGRVISNILNLSRLEKGGRKYRLESVRLDAMLLEVLSDYQLTIETHEVEVETKLPVTMITSDNEMLSHVFANLVNNAIKYRSHSHKPWLGIFIEKSKEKVLVKVSDNGIGLTEDEKNHVFERFYQVSASAPGSGVGLAITKMIVEDLNGHIWLESAGLDQGTTVLVELPVVVDRNKLEDGAYKI